MKANEFRIGNFVGTSFFTVGKIISIQKDFVDVDSDGIISSKIIDELKPIKLTEDILLKCGFEKKESEGEIGLHFEYFLKKYVSIVFNYGAFHLVNIDIDCDDLWSYYNIGTNITYLHQLQNLYFALNGEELEIDLNK